MIGPEGRGSTPSPSSYVQDHILDDVLDDERGLVEREAAGPDGSSMRMADIYSDDDILREYQGSDDRNTQVD